MLIECHECGHSVSDRAKACPQCAFPVAEHVQQQLATSREEKDKATRRLAGRTDCPNCVARGFKAYKFVTDSGEERDGFTWCWICDHSGRIALCHSERGFWAVSDAQVTSFLEAGLGEEHEGVTFLGESAPKARYPTAATDNKPTDR